MGGMRKSRWGQRDQSWRIWRGGAWGGRVLVGRSDREGYGLRIMSQHRSLRGQGAIKAKRNVLKRFERVEVLKKRGQFKEGQSVIGLKKTKPDE